ncbi:MAG: GH1 family beta-glucosidase [Chitinispirillia bacterium]|nr:GH1 family beta-glucosidase [Chitinispirillia bacterium]MCL2241773.1 GH1 family beta-glucosidase [Chitinispirillia bacterium]
MSFPKNFVWGAATAAYQVEGAALEDGKGEGIWDALCRRPGAVWQGHSGEVACGHYHRYVEDVGIMGEIGIGAYRMEVAWTRVMPEGCGAVNQKGIDFYDRLFDELLKAGITPWVTLYHWNLPQALQRRGGWMSPESPKWFEDYTAVVMDRFSDRVSHWMTINEPQVITMHGMMTGFHAPGYKLSMAECLQAGHHLLLAHGRSVSAIRQHSKVPAKIGYAPVGWSRRPATESPGDVDAARIATFEVDPATLWNSAWWMDPVFLGKYPEQGLEVYGSDVPKYSDDDMKIISQPLDFCGVNIYTAAAVKAGADGCPELIPNKVGYRMNSYDWPITPDVLYWAGKFFYERYKKPLVVTENGTCITECVSRDGCVHDPQRIEFIRDHLEYVERAVNEGIDYAGYFYWSLMDNFEWHWGYKHRFGLVHVDFETGQRIIKDSGRYYADVIKKNGV